MMPSSSSVTLDLAPSTPPVASPVTEQRKQDVTSSDSPTTSTHHITPFHYELSTSDTSDETFDVSIGQHITE
jgi:hypothetical protein